MAWFKLLVIDFDETIISPHSYKLLRRLTQQKQRKLTDAEVTNIIKDGLNHKEGATHFTINNQAQLKTLIETSLAMDDTVVAICSFNPYTAAIETALECMGLDDETISKIKINSYLPADADQDLYGKNLHIQQIIDEIESKNHGVNMLVFMDDDNGNLLKARTLKQADDNMQYVELLVPSNCNGNSDYINKAHAALQKEIEMPYLQVPVEMAQNAVFMLNEFFNEDQEWDVAPSIPPSISMAQGIDRNDLQDVTALERVQGLLQTLVKQFGGRDCHIVLRESSRPGVGTIINVPFKGVIALNFAFEKYQKMEQAINFLRDKIGGAEFNIVLPEMSLFYGGQAKTELIERLKREICLHMQGAENLQQYITIEAGSKEGKSTIKIVSPAIEFLAAAAQQSKPKRSLS